MTTPLLNKLLACATAIEEGDLSHADSLFKDITETETNSATKKVVKYFAEALVRRLYKQYPPNPRPLVHFRNNNDIIGCKFDWFLWFANDTNLPSIYEALRGKPEVHIIDFSFMPDIFLYNKLMKLLAEEAGGELSFRITFIGPKLSDHLEYPKLLSSQLYAAAEEFHINFEWRELLSNSATDIVHSASEIKMRKDEAVAVKWEFELHKLLSVSSDIFNLVMSKLKNLKPEIMVIVEQEADLNSPKLSDRLDTSFKYYSVIFYSLEEDNFGRLADYVIQWERYFRRQISKVVAQEGIGYAERYETWTQWKERLLNAGFYPARLLFREGLLFTDRTDFKIEEHKRRPLLCRHSHPLAITSAWRPELTQLNDGSVDETDIDNLDNMLARFNISQDATPAARMARDYVSHDQEKVDDVCTMMEGNMWSTECFAINQIAASAEVFDMLEYACHVHDLPMALTWISDRREHNKNSRGFNLHIESTACFVNDVRMKEYFDECVRRSPLEEEQGIAGKALQSNEHYFVPDVSKLGANEYPFFYQASEFGLRAIVAIKLESIYMSNVEYLLELFLPLEMTKLSEQQQLINEISSTLRNNCWNSLRVCGGRIDQETQMPSNTPPDISSPLELPSIGSLNSSQINHLRGLNNLTGDNMEIPEDDQEVEDQNSIFEAAPYTNRDNVNMDSSHGAIVNRKRRRTSEVWNYFDEIRENGEVWAICKGCNNKYPGESTKGTTSLRRHRDKYCSANRLIND